MNYTFASTDFTYSDAESDPFAGIKITSVETAGDLELSGVDVAVNDVVSNVANLVFKPAADANGSPYATFGFQVYDGTDYSSSSYTMTVNVNAVNDAPTGSNKTLTTLEDTDLNIATADFGYSDTENDVLAHVEIATAPAAGTLFNDVNSNGIADDAGEILTAGEIISKADLDAGQLKFTPAPDSNGVPYTTFDFRVH
ncbi:MAG: hypothetical protein ACQEQV_09170, partial [Fibrobacterota bacterium]